MKKTPRSFETLEFFALFLKSPTAKSMPVMMNISDLQSPLRVVTKNEPRNDITDCKKALAEGESQVRSASFSTAICSTRYRNVCRNSKHRKQGLQYVN